MRTRTTLAAAALLAAGILLGALTARAADDKAPAQLTEDQAAKVAEDAYIFGYPLVLMDVTKAVSTAVPKPEGTKAPINQFAHVRAFPDATYTDIVSPNADTLYSLAWLDLAKEPMVLSVPDVGKRFYLMQIMDDWTNVFASPGTRTTGGGKGDFAIVGPQWTGKLPEGVKELKSPTNMVWIVGRTQTNGKDDYPAVRAIQDQYKLTPLSAWGKDYTPPGDVPVAKGVDAKTPASRAGGEDGRGDVLRPAQHPDEGQPAGRRRCRRDEAVRGDRGRAGQAVRPGEARPGGGQGGRTGCPCRTREDRRRGQEAAGKDRSTTGRS